MTIGENIKRIRKEKGLTQKKLGELSGINEVTIRSYEAEKYKPKYETVRRIATALGVAISEILDDFQPYINDINQEWKHFNLVEEKLKEIGYSVGHDDDNAYMWINYPDGKLEIDNQQLLDLNNQNNDYLKFQLEQLKQQNIKDFKPNN